MTTYVTPPRPERPSSKAAFQSACQGAQRIAATSSAAPKCTTLGVLKTAIPLLGDDTCTCTCAIKVMTTNIKPVSVAAAVPTMTYKFCHVASGNSAASCMMDTPLDVHANG